VTSAPPDDARRAVEAVWRIESGRLIAGLARFTQDVGLAEEIAQDALVAALERWPESGVPKNPAAWLTTAAKNRAVDLARKRSVQDRKLSVLAGQPSEPFEPDLDDYIGDEMLRLVFTACHPALSLESRVALTLRCLAGLSTDEIARAFLTTEATAAQRIVRAKKALKGIAFELPPPAEISQRLAAVLEVVYLIFNEGYAATAGGDWLRPALCDEAMRLGRLLATLVPDEPEVHGLLALMELQASRTVARLGPDGEPILLPDQDRRRWDRLLVQRGLAGLARAEALNAPVGPYTLQAAIAACHARAATIEQTDWGAIAALYEVLAQLWRSPVVELNRAVAVGRSESPEAGLAIVDALVADGRLAKYPHLNAVRGDLLELLGRTEEASAEFQKAAELTRNEREKALFLARVK
jgi:RNA polymerase sigma factor (sigma-70 family)